MSSQGFPNPYALRSDVESLRRDVREDIGKVDRKIDHLRDEIRADMARSNGNVKWWLTTALAAVAAIGTLFPHINW